MRLIPIESVRPNTVLGKTLYDVEGRILLKAGAVLRELTIEKIKEINILSIYIVVEETITNFPLRPIVKILDSSDASRINLKVNLIKEISIVIDSIVYDM